MDGKSSKKAQITAFLIIGIVLLFVASITYVLLQPKIEESVIDDSISGSIDRSSIQTYVESCLDEVTKDGIRHVLYQGGYFEVPGESEQVDEFNIPYYQGVDIPSPDRFGEQVALFIERNIFDCLGGFQEFQKQGYDISYEDIEYDVSVSGPSLTAVMKLPVSAGLEEETVKFDEFVAQEVFDYDYIYSTVTKLLEEQQQNPGSMPIGALADMSFDGNFSFETIQLEEDNKVIFSLIFTHMEGEPYVFNYVKEYEWQFEE